MNTRLFLFFLIISFSIGAGCKKTVKRVDERANPLRLITDPRDMPDFFDHFSKESLLESLDKSISYLKTHSFKVKHLSSDFSNQDIKEGLTVFKNLLLQSKNKKELDALIKERFDVYISIGNGEGKVHFTGYYKPVIPGSLVKTDEFSYPIYKRPAALVKGQEFYTKRQIDLEGALKGQNLELLYVESRLMAHIVHVQGTAVIRLRSGKKIDIGYHGDNGHPYTSIIKQIVADGYIKKEKISLEALENFFRMNPDKEDQYLMINNRYIFFTKVIGGPFGSLGIEVTPRRSIATHKFASSEYLFPPCGLAFIECKTPMIDGHRVSQADTSFFAINQDTGSAITGPGRADIYYGIGDQAKRYAGFTNTDGKLFYLKLRR